MHMVKLLVKEFFNLAKERGKVKNVFFVDGTKYNLITVSQIFDQGYDVLLKSKNYQRKSVGTGEVVAKVVRIENSVYVLKKKIEKVFLEKV